MSDFREGAPTISYEYLSLAPSSMGMNITLTLLRYEGPLSAFQAIFQLTQAGTFKVTTDRLIDHERECEILHVHLYSALSQLVQSSSFPGRWGRDSKLWPLSLVAGYLSLR